MINLIETVTPETLQEYEQFCEQSCIGVKAIGPLLSYGTQFSFALSFEQRREDGTLISFLSKYYGTLTVYVSALAEESEKEEMRAFLPVLGYAFLVTTPDISKCDPTGPIMMFPKGRDCRATATTDAVEYISNDCLKDFYRLLNQNNPGYIPEQYNDWLVDFSHRIRHGTARSILLKAGPEFCSTAAALVITKQTAFLGAVSTNENCRGKHYAYSCLRFLAEQYGSRRLYLLCMPEKQAFYEKAGMVKCGEYSQIVGGTQLC